MKGERNEQVDRSIDKIENARGLSLLMNERLVNIVKKREGGRKGPHEGGVGEERDTKNGERYGRG